MEVAKNIYYYYYYYYVFPLQTLLNENEKASAKWE